ncbi:hypothetical protein LIA77_11763 [Sarocladium implicatum]|nr:hypothetical protein LIA77_11763 [Sarocladium implicatum]
MVLQYLDETRNGGHGNPQPHTISRLISSYMEPESCADAVHESFRIVELLLLSNHLNHAHSLATALYTHMYTILSENSSKPFSQALEYFWFTHPEYKLPPNAPPRARLGDGTPESQKAQEQWQRKQWDSYRECTRTGWMLDHCNLPEPEDPHIWHETDDAAMIAICARLLAKDKTPNQYPPIGQLEEALAAAEKLYSQPQVPATEWNYADMAAQKVRRHSYYLYRRLVTELAIRVGQLDKAAEILSQGLILDGFNSIDGASLDRFLVLPDIYKVLPLLASKGKSGNPYFIEETTAGELVQQITQTLERRAKEGRQWSLAPERVGWRELLDRLAAAAWTVNMKEYKKKGITSAAEILNGPALEEDIQALEDEVGQLPGDLKEMLRIADGFQGGWHFLQGGLGGCTTMSFDEDGNAFEDLLNDQGFDLTDEQVDKIDHLETHSIVEVSPGAGQDGCDGFRHVFVLPAVYRELAQGREGYEEGEYRYWHWASWRAEPSWYRSVREWVALSVEELERKVEDGEIESGPEEEEEEKKEMPEVD